MDQATRHNRQAEAAWCAARDVRPGFFFFGTLMDRDVLGKVLDRPVTDLELKPARLSGYRRVATAREAYPVLVPDPAGTVEGVLLCSPSGRDDVRIRHFEEDEFVDRRVTVELHDGRKTAARAFFAVEDMEVTTQSWDLGAWAREEKARYLQRCRHWMHDCPE